jgi:hypothetical protein
VCVICCVPIGDDKNAQALSLSEAVSKGIIANETLAYFIGRTWLFFLRVGVNPTRMRFRQHLQVRDRPTHTALAGGDMCTAAAPQALGGAVFACIHKRIVKVFVPQPLLNPAHTP